MIFLLNGRPTKAWWNDPADFLLMTFWPDHMVSSDNQKCQMNDHIQQQIPV